MDKKKRFGIRVCALCVVLAMMASMLLACGRKKEEPAPTQPSEQIQETTEATEAATEEATEETTEVTEEATEEPTEETTEETTEPTTAPTTGGNSKPGGTGGYNPGYDNDDDDKEEEPEATVPPISEPGAEDNPYAEVLAAIPGTVSSVKIPAGRTIHYIISGVGGSILTVEDADAYIVYGDTTYNPDENGVITVDLSDADPAAAVSMQIGNNGTEEEAYALNFGEPVGGVTNPEVIESIESIQVSLEAGDEDGYSYLWTADEAGTLSFTVANITEGTQCDVIVTVGDTTAKLSDSTDGTVSVEVAEGDAVTIQIIAIPDENGEYPAMDAELTGEVKSSAGTEENPIVVQFAGEPIVTEQIPAGSSLYYNIYGVGDMILTIADPDAYVIYNGMTYGADANGNVVVQIEAIMPMMPTVMQIGNASIVDESYQLSFAYHVGSMMNPAQLVIGENTAAIEAGSQGYFYTWTAEENGTLIITMPSDLGWTYTVNNLTAGAYGDTQWSDSDPIVNPAEAVVSAGDELQITVCTYDAENPWSAPAGELTITAEFTADPGQKSNPIFLYQNENTVENEGTVYYQGYVSGMIMTVTGEGDFSVIYNDETMAAESGVVSIPVSSANPRMPVIFAIVGDGAFAVNFTYPAGNMMNPAQLAMGENIASIEAGNSQGYYFTWTAEEDGVLIVTMPDDMGWIYTINNLTAGVYGDNQWSDSDPVVNPSEVEVAAGDEIQLIVNTYDPEDMWSNPAGDLTVYAAFESFASVPGSEELPIDLTYDLRDGYATVTVPAGTTYYYLAYNVNGMLMSINGGQAIPCVTAGNRVPHIQRISNNGKTPAVYVITVFYPAGSFESPAELVLGENTASIEAGNTQGYYFTWTASEDGTLIITMPDGNWTYTVNNLTAGINGKTQWSDSDPVVNPAEVEVSTGDEIQLIVNTYNPEDPWNNPAGTLVIGAAFEEETTEHVHSYTGTVTNPTCTTGGYTTYTCACGDSYTDNETAATGHSYVSTVVDPTTSSQGYTLHTCETCGDSYKDNYTDKLPEETDPTEPDSSLEEYVISDVSLSLGANSLTLDSSAYTTIYEFSPDEAGVYQFTASGNSSAVLGYWGANSFFLTDQTANKTGTLEYELKNAGPSIMVGVTGSGSVTLTITRTGDAVVVPENTYKTYSNDHTPDADYVLLTGDETMTSVDITETHTAVKGSDGYYHLDSASGPILYVDFKNEIVNLYNAFYGAYGANTMRGKPVNYVGYDYLDAVKEYVDAAYNKQYYPLTADLITFLKDYGEAQGWFNATFSSFESVKDGTAKTPWMVLCVYPE